MTTSAKNPIDGQPVCVILGATSGVGSALSQRLARQGTLLLLAGRNEQKLSALAAETGGSPWTFEATRTEEVEACVARAIELHGRLDGLVNCVGSLLLKPAHLTSDTEWAEALSINLNSSFTALRAAVRVMKSGGSIVLLSSAAARVGLANHEAIAAAKAAVAGLALSAAATYASRGIRVNCVSPGLVRSQLTARLVSNEASLKASAAMHALGRIGEPEEVASAIVWLLDRQNSWVTGQVIGVDGGLATVRSR